MVAIIMYDTDTKWYYYYNYYYLERECLIGQFSWGPHTKTRQIRQIKITIKPNLRMMEWMPVSNTSHLLFFMD